MEKVKIIRIINCWDGGLAFLCFVAIGLLNTGYFIYLGSWELKLIIFSVGEILTVLLFYALLVNTSDEIKKEEIVTIERVKK